VGPLLLVPDAGAAEGVRGDVGDEAELEAELDRLLLDSLPPVPGSPAAAAAAAPAAAAAAVPVDEREESRRVSGTGRVQADRMLG
jgi:hypothetical protein